MDKNFRIKKLCAHHNKITTLEGSSIANMKFLEELQLGNNYIKNLDKVLAFLSHFSFLNYLTLENNPVAAETNYRLRVIGSIPSLTTLDSHYVTDEERAKAKAALLEMKGIKLNKPKPKPKPINEFTTDLRGVPIKPGTNTTKTLKKTKPKGPYPISACTRLLFTEEKEIKKKLANQSDEFLNNMFKDTKTVDYSKFTDAPLPSVIDFRTIKLTRQTKVLSDWHMYLYILLLLYLDVN